MRKLLYRPKQSKTLSADSFPVGLRIYAQPSSDTEFDLIFVHGLTGGRESTWTADSELRPWFETLLPQTCSSARITAYGYDANVTDYRSLVSENRIENHAKNLLSAIGQERSSEGISDRPIIFIAHSLGGLVCMDTLLASKNSADDHLKDILNSILAIAFVGTPHSGSALAVWGERTARTLDVIKQANSEIISVLRAESEVLARIQNDFHTMLRDRSQRGERKVEITCFYEELPLPVVGTVVPRNSAILPQYIAIGIHSDHMGMTKFASREDPGYKSITREIDRWIRNYRLKSNGKEPVDSNALFSDVYNIDWNALRQALDPTDSENSIQHFLRCRTRLNGTAEWLFDVESFRTWEASMKTGETLWICGPPGCGKSVLAGSIIERLRTLEGSNKANVFYNYCTHSNKSASQCYALITTFVYHLAHSNLAFAEALCSILRSHGVLKSESLASIIPCEAFWKLAEQAICKHLATFGRIIWAIDGLDEVGEVDRELLIEITFQIKRLIPAFKIIVLSRDEHDIRQRMSYLEPIEVKVTEESNRHDLQNFIATRVRTWGALGSPSLAQEVVTTLNANAKGIFLWAKLIIDELEHLHDLEQVKPALTSLPADMKELYSTIFKRISSRLTTQELYIFHGIVQWVTFAKEKLSLKNIAAALSYYGSFTVGSLKQSVPRLCGSLIIIEDSEGLSDDAGIRLLHASLTDYLNDGHAEYDAIRPGRAHAIMARDCFEQLRKAAQCPLFYPVDYSYPYKYAMNQLGKITASWGEEGPGIIDPESPGDESLTDYITVPYIDTRYPLFSYACENCAYHAEQSAIDKEAAVSAAEFLLSFIFDVNPARIIWLSRLDFNDTSKEEVFNQLLAFSSALGNSNTFLARNVQEVAVHLTKRGINGWLHQMRKVKYECVAQEVSATEKAQCNEAELIPDIYLTKKPRREDEFADLEANFSLCTRKHIEQVDAATLRNCIKEISSSFAASNIDATHRHHFGWLAIKVCYFLNINGLSRELDDLFMIMDKASAGNLEALEIQAQMFFIIEDYRAAAKAFNNLVRDKPSRWDIKEILISTLQLDGQMTQALQVLKSYHSDRTETLDHWCVHAWIEKRRAMLSLEAGRFEEHLTICNDAVDRYPEFLEFWQKRQEALARSEGMDVAAQSLKGAKRVQRLALRASKYLADYFLSKGLYEEALAEASASILKFPYNYRANEILWDCWRRSPQTFRPKVFEELKELASAPDPYWIALTYYAVACIQTDKLDEAVKSCEAAIAIETSNGIPYYFAGKTYELLRKPTDALNILCSASPDKYSDFDNMYNYIAVLARKLERWADLVNALLHLKTEDTRSFTISDGEGLAYAYLRNQCYTESESICRETLATYEQGEISVTPQSGHGQSATSAEDPTEGDDARGQKQRLQSILAIALSLQNKAREAKSYFLACTYGSPPPLIGTGLLLQHMHMFSMASFCFDAALQSSQEPDKDSQGANVNSLEHRFWTCDSCEESNFRRTAYSCADCEDYDICITCFDEAYKDHNETHIWLKYPSSAYPRLRLWEENGLWQREIISFDVELIPGIDIIRPGDRKMSAATTTT